MRTEADVHLITIFSIVAGVLLAVVLVTVATHLGWVK
ncbi:hypothetical protein LCGC14_1022760 [marine sediment metagenome]|uniref:Uncharacterized protein n=1 Tax=marine sediment metagenome TaxID=412755 RepID=A0A0F9R2X9_9ZZZZ